MENMKGNLKMTNNPIGDNKNFFGKIFTKNSKKKENTYIGSIEGTIISENHAVPIVAEACACCWNRPIPTSYDTQAEYIAKRSRIGHTSVTEHSNCVMLLKIPNEYSDDLIKLVSACRYLRTAIKKSTDNTAWYLLIGGSYRAYSDLIKNIDNIYSNTVLQFIIRQLKSCAHSCFFEDILKDEHLSSILQKEDFENTDKVLMYNCSKSIRPAEGINRVSTKLFDILWIDNIDIFLERLNNALLTYGETKKIFNERDVYDFLSVTILFKNMSRTCTHQLVRHRNAITQESQRYVNYSDASFASPDRFTDRYDSNIKYNFEFGGNKYSMTLADIGKAEIGIYKDLTNKSLNEEEGIKQALLKEDARAFLPSNVECGKIFMTFTFSNLFMFFILRVDTAAQAEIRTFASSLYDWCKEHNEFINELIRPKYAIDEYIAEDIDTEEFVGEPVKSVEEIIANNFGIDTKQVEKDYKDISSENNYKNNEEV